MFRLVEIPRECVHNFKLHGNGYEALAVSTTSFRAFVVTAAVADDA
jgi:hypothetical protein